MAESIFEDTNPRSLTELLAQIRNRETVLPDFQRDFVWDPGATQELIVSIAMNYPAGSLLRIRNTNNLFAYREFAGAPSLKDGDHINFLVLDGQQRLTSLYQAFNGVGEHRYFLDIGKLIQGADIEDALFHFAATSKESKALENDDSQFRQLQMSLSVLKEGLTGFTNWGKAARKHPDWVERRDWLEEQLDSIEELWIRTIYSYAFPVVTLSDKTSAEAVCTIFETLNRTGVKLSVFELLTARFWPSGLNLRDLWSSARERHPILEDFDIDPYYILQAIALATTSPTNCKRSDVLQLKPDVVQKCWDKVCRAMADGLSMLQEECGVFTPKWLPVSPVVMTLGAVLAAVEPGAGPARASMRSKLVRWYWCSVLGGKYESGPNSQAVKDFGELESWISGGDSPETVSAFRLDRTSLRETTFRQRALYRAMMGLILRNSPRDFHTGKKLTTDLMHDNHVDDHHIFPQKYLDELPDKPTPRVRDCILNRTLIDRKTNQRIGKNPPSTYLGAVRQELGETEFELLLESHLLPSGPDLALTTNDWGAFLASREEALWKAIRTVTGYGDDQVKAQQPQT